MTRWSARRKAMWWHVADVLLLIAGLLFAVVGLVGHFKLRTQYEAEVSLERANAAIRRHLNH